MPMSPPNAAKAICALCCFTSCHFSFAVSFVWVSHMSGINSIIASVGRLIVARPIIYPVSIAHITFGF